MKIWKIWKRSGAVLLAVVLAGAMAVPAAAKEEREKITKVALTFSAYDSGDEGEYGEVEVTADSGPYGVDEVEFLSSTSSTSYPRVRVTMYADDDAYFASASKSLFDLDGEGASYVSASRRDSNSCIVLTVQLKKYSGAVADVPEGADWEQAGIGTWDEVANAAYYEVRLKRGGAMIGETMKVDDTRFDFTSMITQTGQYSFQVRSVNRYMTSKASKWASSERWDIDDEALSELRGRGGSTNNFYTGSTSGSSGSTSGTVSSSTNGGPSGAVTGWQRNNVGYWYRNYDGTWPAARWQQINGYWYYFNQDGYMVANNWLHHTDGKWYYLGPNGAMLTNTRTPDNYYVDANGVYIPGR